MAVTTNALKAARLSAGMKQAEVACYLKVAEGTVSNWEKGVSQPCADQFGALCYLYKREMGALFAECYPSSPYVRRDSLMRFSQMKELFAHGVGTPERDGRFDVIFGSAPARSGGKPWDFALDRCLSDVDEGRGVALFSGSTDAVPSGELSQAGRVFDIDASSVVSGAGICDIVSFIKTREDADALAACFMEGLLFYGGAGRSAVPSQYLSYYTDLLSDALYASFEDGSGFAGASKLVMDDKRPMSSGLLKAWRTPDAVFTGTDAVFFPDICVYRFTGCGACGPFAFAYSWALFWALVYAGRISSVVFDARPRECGFSRELVSTVTKDGISVLVDMGDGIFDPLYADMAHNIIFKGSSPSFNVPFIEGGDAPDGRAPFFSEVFSSRMAAVPFDMTKDPGSDARAHLDRCRDFDAFFASSPFSVSSAGSLPSAGGSFGAGALPGESFLSHLSKRNADAHSCNFAVLHCGRPGAMDAFTGFSAEVGYREWFARDY